LQGIFGDRRELFAGIRARDAVFKAGFAEKRPWKREIAVVRAERNMIQSPVVNDSHHEEQRFRGAKRERVKSSIALVY
jgi:hypothetical protein